jgi:ribosomal protein S27E
MGKVTETKKGKPVEKYRVKCAICSLTQDVRRDLVNAQCERCGADLAPPKTG